MTWTCSNRLFCPKSFVADRFIGTSPGSITVDGEDAGLAYILLDPAGTIEVGGPIAIETELVAAVDTSIELKGRINTLTTLSGGIDPP